MSMSPETPATNSYVTRFFGGPPLSVIFRLVLLSILIGVILGWQVHPAFYGLSAFIGGGLLFAGLSDTCGMGMMLARMPWNK